MRRLVSTWISNSHAGTFGCICPTSVLYAASSSQDRAVVLKKLVVKDLVCVYFSSHVDSSYTYLKRHRMCFVLESTP